MAISVNWATKVINVPQADLTPVSAGVYSLDLNVLRLALKDLEDDATGMSFPTTHNHNGPVTVGGVTLSRVLEIINGYTVTFEDGQYAVNLFGANSNVSDVTNVNQVSVRSANSAGLTQPGAGASASQVWGYIIEAGFTAEQLLRLFTAVLTGNATELEGTTPKFRDLANVKDRVVATQGGGTRVVTTRDGT